MSKNLAVIIHGGAGNLGKAAEYAPQIPVLKHALDAAWSGLLAERDGQECVVEALSVLEESEYFNAGYGALPDAEDKVSLDVALMCGSGDFVSLLGVRRLKYPARLAFDLYRPGMQLMRIWDESLLQGVAYDEITKRDRYGMVAEESQMISPFARSRESADKKRACIGCNDTVGCVVRDGKGRIFAGTSTGGMARKPKGRVGDAPIIGAGVFADDTLCGLSATGHGEAIMRSLLSSFVIARMRATLRQDSRAFEHGSLLLTEILESELDEMQKKSPGSDAGLIVIPAQGPPAYGFRAAHMSVAIRAGTAANVELEEIKVLERAK